MPRRVHPVGGKVVLVTGAARGIGAEAARQLAARGAWVALLDRDADALARVGDSVPRSHAVVADVADRAQMEAAVADVVAHLGGIDVVVACAGVAAMGFVGVLDPGHFERVVAVNLTGSFNTFTTALPEVIARRGYMLSISSISALAHVPGLAAYGASKAGAEALCDSLRAEVAHRGVGVGVAYFSWVGTDMVRDTQRSRVGAQLLAAAPAPFNRIAPVADAGAAVVRAVERRSDRAFHPPAMRALLPLRGLVQPRLEARLGRHAAALEAASTRRRPR